MLKRIILWIKTEGRTNSYLAHMYGLPKIHKDGIWLKSIEPLSTYHPLIPCVCYPLFSAPKSHASAAVDSAVSVIAVRPHAILIAINGHEYSLTRCHLVFFLSPQPGGKLSFLLSSPYPTLPGVNYNKSPHRKESLSDLMKFRSLCRDHKRYSHLCQPGVVSLFLNVPTDYWGGSKQVRIWPHIRRTYEDPQREPDWNVDTNWLPTYADRKKS